LPMSVCCCCCCCCFSTPTGGYTTERIRQLFAAQPGLAVEDVVHKEPKHKKKAKASALVVLGSVTQVTAATQLVLGDATNPLLILPYYKVVPGAAAAAAVGGGTPPGTPPHLTSSPATLAAAGGGGAAAAVGGAGPGRPLPTKPLFPVMAAARPAPKPAAPLFPGEWVGACVRCMHA
jgi:hypothetical protein